METALTDDEQEELRHYDIQVIEYMLDVDVRPKYPTANFRNIRLLSSTNSVVEYQVDYTTLDGITTDYIIVALNGVSSYTKLRRELMVYLDTCPRVIQP